MRSSTLTFSLINRQAGVLCLASCLRPGWETQRSAELTSFELSEADRISSFTVTVRPVASLIALGARLSGSHDG